MNDKEMMKAAREMAKSEGLEIKKTRTFFNGKPAYSLFDKNTGLKITIPLPIRDVFNYLNNL